MPKFVSMTSNSISEYTRRDLFDHLTLSEIDWSGRMAESDFLERIFRISKLGSHDSRASSMLGDVVLHRENFYDWGGSEWIYTDGRLDLLECPDEKLLEFLAFVVHPLVRPDQEVVDEVVKTINQFLIHDGYQLEAVSVISGKRIFAAVMVAAQHAADTKDAARVADDMASDYVAAQVTRMKTSIMTDPALAIGSAKEFVESIAKGILREQNIPITGNETITALVQMARKELSLTISPGVDDILKRTLSGLSNITQGLAELRGKLGTGHGASPDTGRAPVEVARLAVGMATTLGVFLYEVHRNTRKSPEVAQVELVDLDEEIPF
jgi:hypothetical protein